MLMMVAMPSLLLLESDRSPVKVQESDESDEKDAQYDADDEADFDVGVGGPVL